MLLFWVPLSFAVTFVSYNLFSFHLGHFCCFNPCLSDVALNFPSFGFVMVCHIYNGGTVAFLSSPTSPNMSDNCALDTSGKLKDAAHIRCYNDADDDTAMNSPNVTHASSPVMGSTASSSAPRDAFTILLRKGKAPATLTAGARHSTHTCKPSGKLHDSQNAARPDVPLSTLISSKRPAETNDDVEMPSVHKSRKATVEDVDDDKDDIFKEDEPLPELIDNWDDEDNDPEVDYNCTKAMGDADHTVGHYLLS
jgi:hypothetical protein